MTTTLENQTARLALAAAILALIPIVVDIVKSLRKTPSETRFPIFFVIVIIVPLPPGQCHNNHSLNKTFRRKRILIIRLNHGRKK